MRLIRPTKIQHFFLHDSYWMSPCIIMEKLNIFWLTSAEYILENVHADVAVVERMFALSISLQFKNWIIMIPPYTYHNFSSKKLGLWHRFEWFILVNLLPFAWNIVIKDPFFIIYNDILKKQVNALPWKKICYYGYEILFFTLIVWGT